MVSATDRWISTSFCPKCKILSCMSCGFKMCHTAHAIDLLRGEFGEHLISRSEPVNWPPLNYIYGAMLELMPILTSLLHMMYWKTTLKHLFVRYRPKCWKEYAKIALSGWTISGAVVVNICKSASNNKLYGPYYWFKWRFHAFFWKICVFFFEKCSHNT